MRPIVRPSGLVLIGFVSLALGVGGGCGGEPNEEGITDSETTVPADAPSSMEEMYEQQMGGEAPPAS